MVDDRNVEVRKLKVDCFIFLGMWNINVIVSNYYIISVLEILGVLYIEIDDKYRVEII